MQISDMRELALSNSITGVKFIESGCSPIVIELSYRKAAQMHKSLLRKNDDIYTFKCLEQAYSICRKAGIHHAELVQTLTHDETECGSMCKHQLNPMQLHF